SRAGKAARKSIRRRPRDRGAHGRHFLRRAGARREAVRRARRRNRRGDDRRSHRSHESLQCRAIARARQDRRSARAERPVRGVRRAFVRRRARQVEEIRMSLSRVFVANRGEIALRVINACRALGVETVIGVSDADRDSSFARAADRAAVIGPARSSESYLSVERVIAAAKQNKADALHPGYGFWAERPELAEACAKNHIKFIGPTAESILKMGNKLAARALAKTFGVPVGSGSEKIDNAKAAEARAEEIGFPVLIKAAAGGGGRGMKVVAPRSESK